MQNLRTGPHWQRLWWPWKGAISSLILGLVTTIGPIPGAIAQIIPDTTLPTNSTLPPGCNLCLITGGTLRGPNLFHSFQAFNVSSGQVVFFDDPGVSRILSRVTGNSPTNIQGILGVLGTADLFLINPSGILFGPGAELRVQGSFIASTANSVVFSDGTVFSATNPSSAALLTVNVPVGLQYGNNPAGIQVQSALLEGAPQQTLALVGGDVRLTEDALLQVADGRIELGGVSQAATVGLAIDNNRWSLQFPESTPRADVTLRSRSVIQITSDQGGSVVLNAKNVELAEGAQLISFTFGTENATGGIFVSATDSIAMTGYGSLILSLVDANASGNGAPLVFNTRTFSVTDQAQIGSLTLGQGKAGDIAVNASESLLLAGTNVADEATLLVSQSAGVGNGGTVAIATPALTVIDDAQLGTLAFDRGNGGHLQITTDSVVVQNSGLIGSVVGSDAQGQGGNLNITTRSLLATRSGQLGTNTDGPGNSGTLSIKATEQIVFDANGNAEPAGTGAFSRTGKGFLSPGLQAGKGGDILIDTPDLVIQNGASVDASAFRDGVGGNVSLSVQRLSVLNGAQIGAGTLGKANAGNVVITATDSVLFDGIGIDEAPSGVFTTVEAGASGNGGNINLSARSLTVKNSAILSTLTAGQGNAGQVTVVVADTARFEGGKNTLRAGGITSRVNPGAIGNGGKIAVTAKVVAVTDGAELNARTQGQGAAGNIAIAGQQLDVRNGGRLLTSTATEAAAGNITLNLADSLTLAGKNTGLFANTDASSSGRGGNIVIDPRTVVVRDGAQISVDSQGSGTGGNISIQAGSLTLENQAAISATTTSNTGGNIALDVQDILLLRRGSLISTTAGTAQGNGDGGNINIRAGFILAVPFENSDITANAFRGRGGNIAITTQGIFGLTFRDRLTPFSDITASSEFGLDGSVSINTLGIDPIQRAAELPTAFTAPPLAQGCQARGSQQSRFVNTGQGGVPPNPTHAIAPTMLWPDLEPIPGLPSQPTRAVQSATPTPIIEAQGWVVSSSGSISLVAASPSITAHPVGLNTSLCP